MNRSYSGEASPVRVEPSSPFPSSCADPLGRSPDALEARKISGDSVAALGVVEAEHGDMSSEEAVGILIDEELAVSTIDRVVQSALVQPDLDALCYER